MAAGQTIMLRSLLTGDILIYCIKLQSLFKCAVVKLQAHLYLLINVVIAKKVWTVWTNDLKASCWDSTETHAFLLGHLDFPSSNTTNTLTLPASSITNPLRRTQTNNLSSQTAHAAAPTVGQPAAECRPPWSQAFGCFMRTLSAICLALYRDTPIPTVAIVMAMGSMRLLCGCIRTSPETCLCRPDGQTDTVVHIKATMCIFLRDCGSFQSILRA